MEASSPAINGLFLCFPDKLGQMHQRFQMVLMGRDELKQVEMPIIISLKINHSHHLQSSLVSQDATSGTKLFSLNSICATKECSC